MKSKCLGMRRSLEAAVSDAVWHAMSGRARDIEVIRGQRPHAYYVFAGDPALIDRCGLFDVVLQVTNSDDGFTGPVARVLISASALEGETLPCQPRKQN